MRRHRLLTESGSAVVESVFAIVLLALLALGVVQVALTIYARNVLASAAHEGARAAVESGRAAAEAELIARRTVASAAGGLVDDVTVSVTSRHLGGRSVFNVTVVGSISPLGPVPLAFRMEANATSSRSGEVP